MEELGQQDLNLHDFDHLFFSRGSRAFLSQRERSPPRSAVPCYRKLVTSGLAARRAIAGGLTASLPPALAATSASSKNLRRPCAQATGLGDRSWLSVGLVEPIESGVSIGLQNPGIFAQVTLGMLGRAIARIEEHCGWWSRTCEGFVVAHI